MSEAGYPLFSNLFQIGYATSNLDRAMATLHDTHGVNSFKVMRDVAGNGDMKVHIALAYVGDLMLEIIEPAGGGRRVLSRFIAAQ